MTVLTFQSDDVISTQERMVRDSIISSVRCKGLLYGLHATELHIILCYLHVAWGIPYCPSKFMCVCVCVCVREAGRLFFTFFIVVVLGDNRKCHHGCHYLPR